MTESSRALGVVVFYVGSSVMVTERDVKMTIAVNGRFLTQPITGVQRFATEIVRALGSIAPNDVVVYTPPDSPKSSISGVSYRSVGRFGGHRWEQLELPRALRAAGSPPLVSLCNVGPIFYNPHYYTLHDVNFRRNPRGYSKSFLFSYGLAVPILLWRARHVFTVSDFSAGEIAREYKVPREKISVLYNAVSPDLIGLALDEINPRASGYFMTIGSVGSNKNIETLFAGYTEYRARGGAARLVVVGPTTLSAVSVPDGVDLVGRISDAELARYYSTAIAYVSASLYEGFGIPLIEAQFFGCPVLASRIPIHEEVLGETADYFEAKSGSELATLFTRIEAKPQSEEKTQLAKMNAARFSWMGSARHLLDTVNQDSMARVSLD